MPLAIIEESGPIVSAKISGALATTDVSQIQAAAMAAIRRCGKISALFVLDDFRGWTQEPELADVSFLNEHDRDIAKIAVVGDAEWRPLMYAFLAKGFRQAAVAYFLPGDLAKAREWLSAP